MKKGFTLVELITVIALVALISVLVLPNIITKIQEQSKKLDSQLENMLISSASLYVDNSERITKNKVGTCISVSKLIKIGYLDKSILNSYGGQVKNNTSVIVTFDNNVPQYTIDYYNYCAVSNSTSTLKTRADLDTQFLSTYLDTLEKIYTYASIPIDKYVNVGSNDIYDASTNGDKAVIAWITDSDNNNKQELHLAQNGGVKANPDSNMLFSSFTEVNEIDLSALDTSEVTNMSFMFSSLGRTKLTTLELGNRFDTGKVTDMSYMFEGTGLTSLSNINLGENFNTENVTNMSHMFCDIGTTYLTTLNLGSKFDTSKVTNMDEMFSGVNAHELMTTLDLGPKFTSIAASNRDMFTNTGASGCVIKAPNAIRLDSTHFRLNSTSSTTIEYTRGTIQNAY